MASHLSVPSSSQLSASSTASSSSLSHSGISSPNMSAVGSGASQSLLPVADAHMVSLKVMRLYRPSLTEMPPPFLEPTDHAQPVLNALVQREYGVTQLSSSSSSSLAGGANTSARFALGETLRLQSHFGTTYLGEVFAAILCINNESTSTLRDVIVKAELRTASQRVPMHDTTDKPRAELAPNESLDVVVQHEIKELGLHTLMCAVHYVTAKDERKFFNQSFRFQVQHPLSVKTKVYTVKDNVFLEAQVQNVTPRVIFLESVRFDPPPTFLLEDYSSTDYIGSQTPEELELRRLYGPAGLPSLNTLGPQDVLQYLYMLRPALARGSAAPAPNEMSENEMLLRARQSATLGKLDIVWRTTLGERGRLQTAQLQRKPVAQGETVAVNLASLPTEVVAEVPFEASLACRNMTDKPLDLVIAFNKARMAGIMYIGNATTHVGTLPPFATVNVPVKLIALAHGLQQLTGLTITDATQRRSTDIDRVGDVFVRRDKAST